MDRIDKVFVVEWIVEDVKESLVFRIPFPSHIITLYFYLLSLKCCRLSLHQAPINYPSSTQFLTMVGLRAHPPFIFTSSESSSPSSTPSRTSTPSPHHEAPSIFTVLHPPTRRAFSLSQLPTLPTIPSYGTLFTAYRNPLSDLFAPSPTSSSGYEASYFDPSDELSDFQFCIVIIVKGVGIGLVILTAMLLVLCIWKWYFGGGL